MKSLKILYRDENVCVCIKPYDVNSEISSGENMPDLLKTELGCEVFPVHRLDKTTGGIMVYALNSRSAALLSAQIADGRFKKEYRAVIHGVLQKSEGELTDLLFYDRNKSKSYVVKRERKGVKAASLYYSVTDTAELNGKIYSLVSVRLKTGRTHQIRVQFASRNHPVAGDRRYGSDIKLQNMALWSFELEFYHPVTKEKVVFKADPEGSLFNDF